MILHRPLAGVLVALACVTGNAQDCPRTLDPAAALAIPEIAGTARVAAEKICRIKPATDLAALNRDLAAVLLEFLQNSGAQMKSLGILESVFPFDARVLDEARKLAPTGQMPNMIPWSDPAPGFRFTQPVVVRDLPACESAIAAARGRIGVKSCGEFFDAYVALYSYAQNVMQYRTAEPVETYLARMQQVWEDFLAKSRSQTPLELWINTRLWQKDEKAGRLLEPPTMQMIFLHPSVVMERVGQAADGSHTKEGVLLEIGGVNYWRNDRWNQWSGASVVAVYSERPDRSGWRPGVAVHFGNKYTLGVTQYGGVRGWFLSVDVLELAKDKKNVFRDYVDAVVRK